MPEGTPPQDYDPTAATRLLIWTITGSLMTRCVEKFDPSTNNFDSGVCLALAIISVTINYNLKHLPALVRTLNLVANDARWWIGLITACFFFIGLAPILQAPAPAQANLQLKKEKPPAIYYENGEREEVAKLISHLQDLIKNLGPKVTFDFYHNTRLDIRGGVTTNPDDGGNDTSDLIDSVREVKKAYLEFSMKYGDAISKSTIVSKYGVQLHYYLGENPLSSQQSVSQAADECIKAARIIPPTVNAPGMNADIVEVLADNLTRKMGALNAAQKAFGTNVAVLQSKLVEWRASLGNSAQAGR